MVFGSPRKRSRRKPALSSRFVEVVAEEVAALSDNLDSEQQALKDCFERLPEAKRELLALRYYPGQHTVPKSRSGWGGRTSPRGRPFSARMTLADCVEDALHKENGP